MNEKTQLLIDRLDSMRNDIAQDALPNPGDEKNEWLTAFVDAIWLIERFTDNFNSVTDLVGPRADAITLSYAKHEEDELDLLCWQIRRALEA